MREYKISKEENNIRLDKYVKKVLKEAPLSMIYKLFRKKDIKVNKKPKQADYITQLDDIISIYITKDQELEFIEKLTVSVSSKKQFDVIYEDENNVNSDKNTSLDEETINDIKDDLREEIKQDLRKEFERYTPVLLLPYSSVLLNLYIFLSLALESFLLKVFSIW